MKKLGSVPIPTEYSKTAENKAKTARRMLNELQTGLADVYELDNAKDAANMRAMVANMAAIRFGPNRVGTKVIENTLYVWLKEPEAEAGE